MRSLSIKKFFVLAILLGSAAFSQAQQQKVKPSQRSFRDEVNVIKEKQNKRQDYIRRMQAAQMDKGQQPNTPVMPPAATAQQPKAPVSRQPMVMDKHQNPKKQ